MTTYLDQLAQRALIAQSHHSFILHGGTRDLQLSETGSCSLVDHLMTIFAAPSEANEQSRLVVSYRVGIGWKFALESDKASFRQLTGLDQSSSNGNDSFSGLTSNSSEDELRLDATSAIGLIDALMRQTERRVLVILDRAELICPPSQYDRMTPSDKAILSMLGALAQDRAVETSGNLLILITDTLADLAEPIRLSTARYYAIEITPPEYEERLQIANIVFPQLEERGVVLGLSASEFAQATSMLSRYGLMDIILDASASGELTKDQVKRVKQNVMSQEYGDVLETLDPLPRGYSDIAGQDKFKAYWNQVIADMLSGNYADVPAGILIAGAAGLGKTHSMRGVAGESGLPVINFNIGRLLGSFVGQSERNLERALTAIRSAAPCIVVLDEIETTFPDRASAGPNGDSGVSSRILKRMLEELSNPANRGKIVWVGITNYPNKLDAALSRAGRFDLTVAMLPPTYDERLSLIDLYARKYSVTSCDDQTKITLARSLDGYTNAEIENVIRKVRQLQKTLGINDAWVESPKRVRANTRDVQVMTRLALASVNDSDMLPEEYLDAWRKATNQDQPSTSNAAPSLPSTTRRPF